MFDVLSWSTLRVALIALISTTVVHPAILQLIMLIMPIFKSFTDWMGSSMAAESAATVAAMASFPADWMGSSMAAESAAAMAAMASFPTQCFYGF